MINLAAVKILVYADANEKERNAGKELSVAERNEQEKRLLNEVLPNVAAQMRAPLSILYAAQQDMISQNAPNAALLNRSYYQMMRLAGNLSAADLLNEDSYLRDESNEDIVAFCAKLGERVRPLLEAEGLHFRCVYPQQGCVMLYSESMVERALLNLISNAVKFTPAGGSVTLSVQVQQQDVLLSVSDTGCGIAEDKMDTLFDRYLHSERMDPAPHGLGLGLPLCRAIASMHGGKVFAESRAGRGTRITVVLPILKSPINRVKDTRFDYTGGFSHVLVELSDALGAQAYQAKAKTKTEE